ncbi:hypothetical protein NA57DRAFT_51144 [Rhizodiscina lignyota]|uniref:Uncharacterized protein n=1 Tax=Rhizodiscina lignyota TaxID=1504668 RepID=A0A9P4IU38_9PEZI|nr:hypothetical protein NA57DRAFT_51144 [Rhizodiscina lignyota]
MVTLTQSSPPISGNFELAQLLPWTLFLIILTSLLWPYVHFLYNISLRVVKIRRPAFFKQWTRSVFHFLKLPAELREMVYQSIIDDERNLLDGEPCCRPCYPARSEKLNDLSKSIVISVSNFITKCSLQHLLPRSFWSFIYFRSRGSTPSTSPSFLQTGDKIFAHLLVTIRRIFCKRKGTNIVFTNQQMHTEFTSVLCKKSTFKLFIEDDNHESELLWTISPAVTEAMRKCEVHIVATAGMTGCFDPRVAAADWPLRDKAFSELRKLVGLESMDLRIHARGSQIWNPIWLWHYTSQSFKVCEIKGFKEITFHLEGWSPGENKLCRGDGKWVWRCAKGHFVRDDTPGSMPIREFCKALYDECEECPSRQ